MNETTAIDTAAARPGRRIDRSWTRSARRGPSTSWASRGLGRSSARRSRPICSTVSRSVRSRPRNSATASACCTAATSPTGRSTLAGTRCSARSRRNACNWWHGCVSGTRTAAQQHQRHPCRGLHRHHRRGQRRARPQDVFRWRLLQLQDRPAQAACGSLPLRATTPRRRARAHALHRRWPPARGRCTRRRPAS